MKISYPHRRKLTRILSRFRVDEETWLYTRLMYENHGVMPAELCRRGLDLLMRKGKYTVQL